MKTRDLSIAGILISLQVLTLLIIYVVPTIKLALLFATSLYSGVLLRIGVKKSVISISYFASSLLIIFLVQITDVAVFFVIFFGWYPLLLEITKNMKIAVQQTFRWLGFLSAAVLLYFAITYLITFDIQLALWIYALIGIIAFIILQIIYSFCVHEFVKQSGIKLSDGKIMFKR